MGSSILGRERGRIGHMCGRYSLAVSGDDLVEAFQASLERDAFRPRYNVAPGQKMPVLTNADPGAFAHMTWGLLPSWTKELATARKPINARAETVRELATFRRPFARQRCLVPADGFYEWQATHAGKLPYRITRTDRTPFAFAGLWDSWQGPDGPPLQTFTIITTTPNALMAPMHNRMPVILHAADYEQWLETNALDDAQALLTPYPPAELRAYRVSRQVNAPDNDLPEVIEPVVSKG
jgi:putative SOS response-associated peptidase YedK